jgi:hypothetical protein
VDLVGQRDKQGALGLGTQPFDVLRLPVEPRRLGRLESVAARFDDGGNGGAEARVDVGEPGRAATVLGRVVQECGDCLVLAPAGVDYERTDAQ